MKRIYLYCLLLIAALCFSGQNSLYAVTTSPDLKWAEAQGPVKTIIQDGITMQFDRSGRITSMYYHSDEGIKQYSVHRNSAGQMVKLVDIVPYDGVGELVELYDKFTYDASGYVIETEELFWESVQTTKFANDANGRHKSASYVIEGDGDGTGRYTYTYLEIDAYGNWTKRQIDDVYYDPDESMPPSRERYYASRVIIYWDNSTPDISPVSTRDRHECVDLGLSVLWATSNMQDARDDAYLNNYFLWGETKSINKPYDKAAREDFLRTLHLDSVIDPHSADCFHPDSPPMVLPLERDAAHAKWGGKWRMPTRFEFRELYEKCTWRWTGRGYVVIGPNGNSIYLPAEGYYDSEVGNVQESGEIGHYIACTHDYFHPSSGDSYYLYASSSDILRFDSAEVRPLAYCSDCGYTDGFSIRPVWSERDAATSVVESLRAHADSSVWYYSYISDPARFPGGDEALRTYFATHRNLSYPLREDLVIDADIILGYDGKVREIESLGIPYRNIDGKVRDQIFDEIRALILNMPAWQPAEHRGWPVLSYQPLRIVYRLTDDPMHIFSTSEAEQQPMYPGGEEALNAFLSSYSSPIEGVYFRHATLLADCIIEADGAVKLQQISQDKYFDLDDEPTQTSLHNKVRQIIQAMPAWTPGQRDEKNIRVRTSIPITFTSLPQRSQSHVSIADLAANPLGVSTIDWHSSRHKLFKALQKLDPGLKTEKHRLFGFLQGQYSCYDPISEIEINYEKDNITCIYRISCCTANSATILANTIRSDVEQSGVTNVLVINQSKFDSHYVEIVQTLQK